MELLEELELKQKEREQKLNKLNQQQDSSFDKMVDSLQEITKNEVTEIFSNIIKSQPDITNNIEKEKLKQLKSEMFSLITKINESLTENAHELSIDTIVEKAKKDREREYVSYTGRAYDKHSVEMDIEKILGKQVGKVKPLLENFGYSMYRGNSKGSHSNTWDRDYDDDINEYVYKGFRTYDLIQVEGVKEYLDLFEKILKLEINIDENREKINSLKAENLWDSI